jgi:hypothetical protein
LYLCWFPVVVLPENGRGEREREMGVPQEGEEEEEEIGKGEERGERPCVFF